MVTIRGTQTPLGGIRARKDRALVYRDCSPAYAELLGAREPLDVAGRRDTELVRRSRASLWEATQRLVLVDGVCSATPLAANGRVGAWMVQSANSDRLEVDITVAGPNQVMACLFEGAFEQSAFVPEGLAIVIAGRVVQVDATARHLFAELGQDGMARLLAAGGLQWQAWLTARKGSPVPSTDIVSLDSEQRLHTRLCLSPIRWHRRRAMLVALMPDPASIAGSKAGSQFSLSTRQHAPDVTGPNGIQSALLDASPIGTLLVAEQRVDYANLTAAHMLGYGEASSLCEHTVLPAALIARLDSVAGSDETVQCRWRRQDGRSLHLHLSASRLKVEGESKLIVHMSNQTPLLQRVVALNADRERFHDFAESAADFFFELDADLTLVYLSDRFEAVFGLPADDVLGLTIEGFHGRFIPQPTTDAWLRHLTALRAHQSQLDFEYRWTTGQGDTRVLVHSCHVVTGSDGKFAGFRGVGRDFTRDRELADQVQYHATHDGLTGLVNRREFERLLSGALDDASDGHRKHALCFIDLDFFKHVNDSAGHQAGDRVLSDLGRIFIDCLRQSDVVGRLGGDEFGVIIYNCDLARAERLANDLRDQVKAYELAWEGATYQVGASIGVVAIDSESGELASVMRAADMACYEAKAAGRGRIAVTSSPEDTASQVDTAPDVKPAVLLREMMLPLSYRASGEMQRLVPWMPGDEIDSQSGRTAHEKNDEDLDSFIARDLGAVSALLVWLREHAGDMSVLERVQLRLHGGFLHRADALDTVARMLESSGLAHKTCFEIPVCEVEQAPPEVLSRLTRWGSQLCLSATDLHSPLQGVSALQFSYGAIAVDWLTSGRQAEVRRSIAQLHAEGVRVQVVDVRDTDGLLMLREMGVDLVAGEVVSGRETVATVAG